MIEAAIFDVDGTLVDSNEFHAQSWQETFRHFGKEIPLEVLRREIGKGADQYLPVFLSERELRAIGAQVEAYRGKLYAEKYLQRLRAFPRVRDLFLQLRHDGKRIALASSGVADELAHYRKLADIDELVDAQTTKDDVAHSKPKADIVIVTLNKLGGIGADEAVLVGDSPYDVEAAKKIGVPTVGLLCGGFSNDVLRDAGAIAIFRDPAELLEKYQRSPLSS